MDIEAVARECYSGRHKRPPLTAAAKKHGIPRHQIAKAAARLGLSTPKTNRRWSDEESAIMRRAAHLSDPVIQQRLKSAGYSRSLAAIGMWRKRHIGTREDARLDAGCCTARKLAELMGVTDRAVGYWVRQGWLRAQRLEGSGRENGFLIIKDADIREFIVGYTAHVHLHLVDKFWLIDILCPQKGQKLGAKPAD
jgi:hypothetical protein